MRFIGDGHTTSDSIFEEGRYKVYQLGDGGDTKITDVNGDKIDLLKESHIENKANSRIVSGISTTYLRDVGLPKEESRVEWVFTQITAER